MIPEDIEKSEVEVLWVICEEVKLHRVRSSYNFRFNFTTKSQS